MLIVRSSNRGSDIAALHSSIESITLELRGRYFVTDFDFRRFESLTRVFIRGSFIDERYSRFVKWPSSIRFLSFYELAGGIDDSVIRSFASCQDVEEVELFNTTVKSINALQIFKKLRKVRLGGDGVDATHRNEPGSADGVIGSWRNPEHAEAALDELAKIEPLQELDLNLGILPSRGLLRFMQSKKLKVLRSTVVTDDMIRLIAPVAKDLHTLDLSRNLKITSWGLQSLREFPALISLLLAESPKLDSLALDFIARCPRLRELDLGELDAPSGIVRGTYVERSKDGLIPLFIPESRYADTERLLKAVSAMTDLERLVLSGHAFVDADLLRAIFDACPKLTDLDVSACPEVSDKLFELLAETNRLVSLRADVVSDAPRALTAPKFTAAGFALLAKCTRLQHLSVQFHHVLGPAIGKVAKALKLKSLNIGGCGLRSADFGKVLACAKTVCVDLANLDGATLTPEEIKSARVTRLDMLECKYVRNSLLAQITQIESLRHLGLYRVELDKESFELLSASKHLKSVDVSRTAISELAAKNAANAPLLWVTWNLLPY